ncbi:RNA-binding domain-containing protein [Nibribacter koreensis]|uniref:ATP-dependent DNA helicase RecG n=1 Tax=Nibribacter koreensis TaxID=1084519 RepID=A0ABP8FPE6_9BACT
MNASDIEQLIRQGEGLSIEFKKCRTSLPKNTFESICAFLNRKGGYLVLGVDDDGTLVGVNPSEIENVKRDFTTLSNNTNKLNPPFLLELKEVEVDGHILLYVYVPQSSQLHKCDGHIFDRGHEGDFKVIDNARISGIYSRKSGIYSEGKIFPHLGIGDFDPAVLRRVRMLVRSRQPGHQWLSLSDLELIQSAGLYRKDFQTGVEGCTLAAALLLGSEDVIHSIIPHYRIDAIVRKENIDRYDDRLDIRTNLIDAYEKLTGFVGRHLPERFFLMGEQRVNLRDIIFREIVANMIVHREYTNAAPARFIIYPDRVETDNANKPYGFGAINPENFSPYPKNPTIARFFVQLGLVEELGSGIRNVTKLLEHYSPDHKAEFIEEDVFRAKVPVAFPVSTPSIATPLVPAIIEEVLDTTSVFTMPTGTFKELEMFKPAMASEIRDILTSNQLSDQVQQRLIKEIVLFARQALYTTSEMAEVLSVHPRTIRRDFNMLSGMGIIISIGFGVYDLNPTCLAELDTPIE